MSGTLYLVATPIGNLGDFSDDRLILYTDGLTDVADAHGDFSGLARLRALLERISHRSALEVCQAIFAELDQYRGQAEQFDDMTLLVLEVT
jgi:sigma-B regulation protein RsbU (phosphoserine phosphatase)